jgi:cytochrome P450
MQIVATLPPLVQSAPAPAPVIPGPRPMRLLGSRGNLIQFRRDPLAYLRTLHDRYGEIAAFVQGRPGTVFAFGPRYNQQLLSNPALFHSTGLPLPGPKGSAQKRISYSLFNMNAEKHARQRQLISPPFHKHALGGYRDTMVEKTGRRLVTWSVGQRLNIACEMKALTIGIAGKLLFDFDEPDACSLGRIIDDWMRVSTSYQVRLLPRDWPGTPYRRMLRLAEELERRIAALIAHRRGTGTAGDDVLSLLLRAHDEEGGVPSDDEVLGQTTVLFSAAHETTADALTWTLFLLAQHPRIMGDLRDELQGVLSGQAPTAEQLGQLSLLDRVIKESMRILPPVPYSTRTSTGPFDLGPYHLPARTTVAYSHFITHRLPDLYAEPQRFVPDRWLAIHPSAYEYLPFGAGPRVCIGAAFATMVLRVVLAMILQRFNLNLIRGTRIDRAVAVTMFPRHGMWMQIEPATTSPRYVPVRGNIHDLVQLGHE